MTIQINTNKHSDNTHFVSSRQAVDTYSPLENPTPFKLEDKYLLSQEPRSLWKERFIGKGDKKGGKDSSKEGESGSRSGNGSGNNVNVNSGNKTEVKVNVSFVAGCELDPRVAEGKDKSKSEKP